MATEPTAEHRLLYYMLGWRKAIGCGPISPEEQADPDFMIGWDAGKAAAEEEKARASERYGATIASYRIGRTP